MLQITRHSMMLAAFPTHFFKWLAWITFFGCLQMTRKLNLLSTPTGSDFFLTPIPNALSLTPTTGVLWLQNLPSNIIYCSQLMICLLSTPYPTLKPPHCVPPKIMKYLAIFFRPHCLTGFIVFRSNLQNELCAPLPRSYCCCVLRVIRSWLRDLRARIAESRCWIDGKK